MILISLLTVTRVVLWIACLCFPTQALSALAKAKTPDESLVTWDENSIFVRGERMMIFSGEFHPFRLPVPDLWLDVLQKIKSMGFTGVSFYTDWGLLEGNPGNVVTEGIWSLETFFRAATQAGIYLIARPGPYINAETTAGGIPGWVLRSNFTIRSDEYGYLNMTRHYMSTIAHAIEKAQITHGGPVIMVQPENEYTTWPSVTDFPSQMNRQYMEIVEQQLIDAGITVPLIVNDNEVEGYWAPGSGVGAADIYGIDSYPLRYDCAHPDVWPTYRFPYDWQTLHEKQSPGTPFAIAEFQGGSGGGWGGVTEDKCAALVNEEALRVVYKNNYGFGVKIFNIYMTYGGTNWGNLGYMGGYTSYDYGAAITETREVWREKFSEQKLQANFLKASQAYLTAKPGIGRNGSFGAPASIAVTPILGSDTGTNFFVVRHADFTSWNSTQYTLSLPISSGNITIPQLGGTLSLKGRDSKIHVTDYELDGIKLLYSSAEIFTWARGPGSIRVLVLYGAENETHELAVPRDIGSFTVIEGDGIIHSLNGSSIVIQWQVQKVRRVLRIGDLEVHLLWRNEAYNYWAMELPAADPIGNFSSPSKEMAVIKAGYLIRNARICGQALCLSGDVNSTTEIEIISIPTADVNEITLNGEKLATSRGKNGKISAVVKYEPIVPSIPDLDDLEWRYLDSLPEIQMSYDDSDWASCSEEQTYNPRYMSTPRSLYSMDYGFHTGSLIYRGHFQANSHESYIWLNTSGGTAFGQSVWLNNTFLSSWTGSSDNSTAAITLPLEEKLLDGEQYIITILIDHMGQDEEAPGTEAIKFPKGILDYHLSNHDQTEVEWKVTGNLGGEKYRDLVRGPLNEGALYAERQGYHYPGPPSSSWKISRPTKDGIAKAGVGFFAASFDLRIPEGWDVPMALAFNKSASTNTTESPGGSNYRCQLFINGYQFGKYLNNLGPQVVFPVPEGVLRYDGTNYIALTLWAQDEQGARVGSIELVPTAIIKSGYVKPRDAPQPAWAPRPGAY